MPNDGTAVPRSSRRSIWIVLAIAWLLVLLRSAVFLFYEQSLFDSDQAVVGLMAKHLAQGRAFPLFFYGQPFLLGVEAWLMAPWFVVFPASVFLLHLSLTITNLAVVSILVIGLQRWCGLTPWQSLIASTFFAFAPPLTARLLIEANGANIEPFLFVLVLWILRERPLWFGAVLGIGFLNREFTIYAAVAVLVIQVFDRSFFRRQTLRGWLLAGITFFAAWNVVDALKPYADLRGPGTRGQLLHGLSGSELTNLTDRIDITPVQISERTVEMLRNYLPRLLGATPVDLSLTTRGRTWMRWFVGIAGAVIVGRLVARRRDRPAAAVTMTSPPLTFAWYLVLVGLFASIGYIATRPVGPPIDRYFLLALYLPVGLVAIALATEPNKRWRLGLNAAVLLWAISSGVDHMHEAAPYLAGRVPNRLRLLADELKSRQIHVADASYWRAYKLTFMTNEQVKVATIDSDRIEEYQALARAAGDQLISIREEPCPGGEKFLDWYLCRSTR